MLRHKPAADVDPLTARPPAGCQPLPPLLAAPKRRPPARLPACPPADRQQQADELCALQAIYGEDFVTVTDDGSYSFAIPEPDARPNLVLRVHLPPAYPSQHPPVFELSCDYLPGDVLGGLENELEGLFSPGALEFTARGFVPRGC